MNAPLHSTLPVFCVNHFFRGGLNFLQKTCTIMLYLYTHLGLFSGLVVQLIWSCRIFLKLLLYVIDSLFQQEFW